MSDLVRTFIAIEIHPEIKYFLTQVQTEIKKTGCDIRWVRPENIHLTLKFLGDISQSHIEILNKNLESMCREIPSFHLTVTDLSVFPHLKHPRIVWLGVQDSPLTFPSLAESIENIIKELRLAKGKEDFHPHITLGRVKSNKNIDQLTKFIESHTISRPIKQTVRSLTLIKSTLTSDGPAYESIKKINLK